MLLGLCLMKPLYAEWDEWLLDTDASFSAEDNINRSIYGGESKSDQFWSGFVSFGPTLSFFRFLPEWISAHS